MKLVNLFLLTLVITGLIGPINVFAHGGKKKNSFEICVNAAVDFAVIDPAGDGPTPGDVFTAVGGIWPNGSILDGDPDDCSALSQDDRIGTFYVNGHLIRSLVDFTGFPSTPDNEIALVVWHFAIDGEGAVDTMGTVVALAPGDTYPQTVIGGTGRYKSVKGVATTTILSPSGFQFRLKVSNGKK